MNVIECELLRLLGLRKEPLCENYTAHHDEYHGGSAAAEITYNARDDDVGGCCCVICGLVGSVIILYDNG